MFSEHGLHIKRDPQPFKTRFVRGVELEAPYDRAIWDNMAQRDQWAAQALKDAGIKLLDKVYARGRCWEARSPNAYYRDSYPKVMIAVTCTHTEEALKSWGLL